MALPIIKGAVAAALAAAAIAVAIGPAAAPAAAQDAMEQTFLRYHAAIHAAVVCEEQRLEQEGLEDPDADRIAANQERMGAVINGKVMGEISAGRRLQLIEEAKHVVEDAIREKSCDSAQVRDWLELFHAELEPVIVE
jgi:hypothetical protein